MPSEEVLVQHVEEALRREGSDEEVLGAGVFFPRGHSGSIVAGGMIGGDVGDAIGGVAGSVGLAGGALGAMHAHDAASGLPELMLVAVTPASVWGFAMRHREVGDLVFRLPRAGLRHEVHPRVNVRVLELTDESSGASVQLEGSRIPIQHARDVIGALED